MFHHYIKSLCLAISILFVVGLTQAVEITQGAMLGNSCAACHGTGGKSPGSIPSLQGKSAEFILKALTEFRDGSRASTVMGRHASGYSDAEIKQIAEFFAAQK